MSSSKVYNIFILSNSLITGSEFSRSVGKHINNNNPKAFFHFMKQICPAQQKHSHLQTAETILTELRSFRETF